MLDHDALAAEIGKPEYSGKADAEILTALRAKDAVVSHQDVTSQAVFGYIARKGLYPGIRKLASQVPDQGTSPEMVTAIGAAQSLIGVAGVNPSFQTSDTTSRAEIFALFDLLVDAGSGTEDNKKDLMELTRVRTPFLEAIGCGLLIGMDDQSALDHLQLARGEDPQEKRKAK